MSENGDYKILPWDSDYFGFSVASILNNRHSAESLLNILNELKNKYVRLVYWASDSNDAVSMDAAKNCNGFLADKKTTFRRELDNFVHFINSEDSGIVEYTLDIATPELLNLGILSGEYSRFRVDKNIQREKFEGLYKLWVINSVNKKVADSIYVKNHENKAGAMVTLQKKENTGIIGLIAVDKVLQGKNIGTALVNKALIWSKQNGCEIAKVVTQYDNKPACRLYEKCGYSIEKIENFYHFWL